MVERSAEVVAFPRISYYESAGEESLCLYQMQGGKTHNLFTAEYAEDSTCEEGHVKCGSFLKALITS